MPKSDQWHGGKGSYRRNENKEAYESNWDRIFGKKIIARPASETEDVVLKMPKEESEEDRFERHMKPIREAQNNVK